jgi:hypothetical protein
LHILNNKNKLYKKKERKKENHIILERLLRSIERKQMRTEKSLRSARESHNIIIFQKTWPQKRKVLLQSRNSGG